MNQAEQRFDDLKQIIITLTDIEGVLKMQASADEISATLNQICDMFPEIHKLAKANSDNDYAAAIEAEYNKFSSLDKKSNEYKKSLHKWVLLSKIGVATTTASHLFKNQDKFIDGCKDLEEVYRADYMPEEVAALGLYIIGYQYRCAEPMYSYKLQLDALKVFPTLGKLLGRTYVYEKNKVKEQISNKCPVCGGAESTPFYNAPQLLFLDEGECFSPVKLWMKCHSCNNLYAYNFPISEMGEINGHYAPKDGQIVLQPRHQLYLYSDIMNKCKGYTDGRKYLEIGVGNGEMIACALEHGFDVSAVEICKEDCETISAALSVPIVWSDFLKFDTDEKYDVIVMGDIIEHVSAPIDALKKAKDMLAPGGVLWLSTPNYNSAYTRMRKFEDAMWNQKNHFTYFSYETMLPFFEAEGLEVLRYDISNRYSGSMELYLRRKM